MEMDCQRLERVGAKYSLMCAGFGVLVAALITTVLFGILAGSALHEVIFHPYFRAPIAVGLLFLAASAWFLGKRAGGLIYRFGLDSPATPIIGILLAFSCVAISIATAFATHFFSSIHQMEMLYEYVIGPAIAVFAFGFVPALLLGIAFSALIRTEG